MLKMPHADEPAGEPVLLDFVACRNALVGEVVVLVWSPPRDGDDSLLCRSGVRGARTYWAGATETS